MIFVPCIAISASLSTTCSIRSLPACFWDIQPPAWNPLSPVASASFSIRNTKKKTGLKGRCLNEMIAYAASDVIYLIPLAKALDGRNCHGKRSPIMGDGRLSKPQPSAAARDRTTNRLFTRFQRRRPADNTSACRPGGPSPGQGFIGTTKGQAPFQSAKQLGINENCAWTCRFPSKH